MIDWRDLKLGDTVYEANPWEGKVYRRSVVRESVIRKWCPVIEREETNSPQRVLFVNQGLGSDPR